MTSLVKISTSQIDLYDLKTGRIRQLRDRRFINNCVVILWTEQSILVTGFDSPEGESLLFHMNTVKIERLPRLIQGRKFHSGAKFQGKAYVLGGYTPQLIKLRSTESFNGHRWSKEPDMIETRSGFSSTSTSTALYVFGDNTSRSIERFDGISWRCMSFSLLYNTQNLCLIPLNSFEMLVIGGGSSVTGSYTEIRLQPLDSEEWTLVDKLKVADYFRSPAVEYEGNLFCVGQKGVHERRSEGWVLHSKDRFCRFCGRWRCDRECKWVRRRPVLQLYLLCKRLRLN